MQQETALGMIEVSGREQIVSFLTKYVALPMSPHQYQYCKPAKVESDVSGAQSM